MAANEPVLALSGVSKRFGAVQALAGVDLEVHSGEVVALVGDNGAGKSTVVKVIAGIYAPDEGEIRFAGRPVTISGPKASAALGIATVYQDLALCDNLDVVGNLFLGHERGRAVALPLDEVSMEQTALDLMKSLSVTTIRSVRTPIAALSGGQRQSVAIARSLIGEPRVVILDEPTAALGVAQTAQVLDLVKRLRERGLGVMVISHNLSDVFAVADRVAVMRLGRRAGDFRVADSNPDEIVGAITGSHQGVAA